MRLNDGDRAILGEIRAEGHGADVPQWDPDLEHDTQHDPALDEEADWYDDEEGGEVEHDCGW